MTAARSKQRAERPDLGLPGPRGRVGTGCRPRELGTQPDASTDPSQLPTTHTDHHLQQKMPGECHIYSKV